MQPANLFVVFALEIAYARQGAFLGSCVVMWKLGVILRLRWAEGEGSRTVALMSLWFISFLVISAKKRWTREYRLNCARFFSFGNDVVLLLGYCFPSLSCRSKTSHGRLLCLSLHLPLTPSYHTTIVTYTPFIARLHIHDAYFCPYPFLRGLCARKMPNRIVRGA